MERVSQSKSPDLSVSIAAAMTLSCALVIGYGWGSLGDSLYVPLSDLAAKSAEGGGLLILKLILLLAFLKLGMTSAVFILGAASVFYSWVTHYSSTGAFFPQIVFNCLLLAAVLRPNVSAENRKSWAAVFLSIVFIVAGIQKVNSSYLAGFEYQSIRGFIGPFRYHFGALPTWLAVGILPWLSIVIEIIIGIGILLRPKLFSQIAVGFILVLFLVNPHLFPPYLTVAVLSFLIFPDSASSFSGRFKKVKIDSAFFWTFIFIGTANLRSWVNRNSIEYFAIPWIFSSIFLWIHGSFFIEAWKNGVFKDDIAIRPSDLALRKNGLVAILLITMLLSPVGYAMGLPGPIGFSMFSGKQSRIRGKEMKIQGEAACYDLERNLQVFITTDVAFRRSGTGCKVIAPTQSGLDFLKRKVCRRFSYGNLAKPIIDGSECSVH